MRSLLFIILISFTALLVGCSGSDAREQKVGRQHRTYVDIERTNWAGDESRPLATTIWYPASANSIESDWDAGVFQFGRNALNAAFVDKQQRPLIVMSHGTGGSAAQLSWLAEELVQSGFVVAAVNHHGNTAVEDRSWPHGFVLPNERARDLTVLIDKLLADPEFSSYIDSSRIGAAGFSLGGYSVLAAVGGKLTFDEWQKRCKTLSENPVCYLPPEATFNEADIKSLAESDPQFQSAISREENLVVDERIRAIYLMAPALLSLMDSNDLSSVRVPVRAVLSEGDRQIQLNKTLQVINTDLQSASAKSIPDAGHYAFLAECTLRGAFYLSELCSEEVDRNDLHKGVGKDAAIFFNKHL